MVKLYENTEKYHFMDQLLKTNLDTAKKEILNDWDMVFCIDGSEGTGKSVLAQQIAYYCDPSLTVDRICFTPEEFVSCIMNAKQYQAVIYDEALTGLSSRSTMSTVNKALVNMMAEIRQKNLFVFIVMPTFFDLDRNIALWRSRVLLHVYKSKDWERGFFAFFNEGAKKFLYMNGKKYYDYKKTKPCFRGRFPNKYVVDEEKYRKKKYDSLSKVSKHEYSEDEARIFKERLFAYIMEIDKLDNPTRRVIMGDMPESTFRGWKKRYLVGKGLINPDKIRDDQISTA